MALIYKPTKLPQEVLDKIKEEVKKKKFKSENAAICWGLATAFKIKLAK